MFGKQSQLSSNLSGATVGASAGGQPELRARCEARSFCLSLLLVNMIMPSVLRRTVCKQHVVYYQQRLVSRVPGPGDICKLLTLCKRQSQSVIQAKAVFEQRQPVCPTDSVLTMLWSGMLCPAGGHKEQVISVVPEMTWARTTTHYRSYDRDPLRQIQDMSLLL